MESQDLPPPPRQMKDGKMAKWLVFGLRAASSLIWGDGPLLFDGGGRGKVENFHMQIYFFLYGCGSCCKRFFCVCLRFPANTLIFLLHFFSVYSLPKQFVSNSPTPVKKTMVRPSERCIPLNLCNSTVFEI